MQFNVINIIRWYNVNFHMLTAAVYNCSNSQLNCPLPYSILKREGYSDNLRYKKKFSLVSERAFFPVVPFLERAHWIQGRHEPWQSSSGTCPSRCKCPPCTCLKTPSPPTSRTQHTSWSPSSPCSPCAQLDHHLKETQSTHSRMCHS